MHAGKLTRDAARGLDAEPLLLPDADPDQGRDHRVEVGGSGVPARLDPPHPRPRRRRIPTTGGLALWLRLAEAVGLDRDEVASCRRVLPGVRFACDSYVSALPREPAGGRGRVVADRDVRARPDVGAHRRLGEALPLGRGARRWRTSARACRARGATARRGWRSWSRTRRRARCRRRASRRWCARPRSCGTSSTACRRRRRGARPMIGPDTRVRLAAQGAAAARSRARASTMLLYPERGLELSRQRRAHRRAVRRAAIAPSRRSSDELAAASGEPRERIESEVLSFLRCARRSRPAGRDVSGAAETPRPYTLVAELTYRCPLACGYCSNPLELARHAAELDTGGVGARCSPTRRRWACCR